MLNVAVIGTGYVGLVSGACLADLGHNVVCTDKDTQKIDALRGNAIPFYEPFLKELVEKNTDINRLKFTSNLPDALRDVQVVIVAVGTPTNPNDGRANLSFLNEALDDVVRFLCNDTIVIIKSTVPIGTCDILQKKVDNTSRYKCNIISNPEFLCEGSAIHDFMYPDRIIIGGSLKSKHWIEALYSDHLQRGIKFFYTSRTTAELVKYSSNAFLAMKVAFINEVASLSEKTEVDLETLIDALGSDSRIGYKFLKPGPGFGGSCFPKDLEEIVNVTSHNLLSNNILLTAISHSNTERIKEIADNILDIVPDFGLITILGLTYKANTCDVRASPAIEIIRHLLARNIKRLKCYDPRGMANAKKILGNLVEYSESLYDAALNSSLIIVITEWDEFKNIDTEKLRCLVKIPYIYDLRNIINQQSFLSSGFRVKTLGTFA